MGVASHPRGAGGSPLFYISTSFTDCTTELYTDAPNALLATLTQPQVQEPSTYWSLCFHTKKKEKKISSWINVHVHSNIDCDSGHIFPRLWTEVHLVTSKFKWDVVVCKMLSDLRKFPLWRCFRKNWKLRHLYIQLYSPALKQNGEETPKIWNRNFMRI